MIDRWTVAGPTFWGNTYHQCVGKHQSPIDIEEQDVESVNLPPLVFENFDEPPQFLEMKNNGHTGKYEQSYQSFCGT